MYASYILNRPIFILLNPNFLLHFMFFESTIMWLASSFILATSEEYKQDANPAGFLKLPISNTTSWLHQE